MKWTGEDSTIVENLDDLDISTSWHIVPYSQLAKGIQKIKQPYSSRVKYVIKPSSILEKLVRKNFTHIIVDESHYIKSKKSLRSHGVRNLCKGRSHRFFLSGTPILSKPIDLAHQLECLGVMQSVFYGWYHFVEDYCNAYETFLGKRRLLMTDGASNLARLNKKLLDNCMVRRKKIDVLKELPPLTNTSIEFELSNRREYDRAHREFLNWLWDDSYESWDENVSEYLSEDEIEFLRQSHAHDKVKRARSAIAMVKINKLKHLSAKGKLKSFKDWSDNVMEQGEKLIVFAHFKDIQKKLADLLPGCAVLSGDDDVLDRQKNIDRFQEEESCRAIVASLAVGSVGHNITAASIVAIMDFPWNSVDIDQAVSRAHRMGQTRPVNSYYLIGNNTVDLDIMRMLAGKENSIDMVLDGKQGNIFNSLISSLGERHDKNNR